RKPMNLARATLLLCTFAFVVGVAEVHAQVDPENVPEPPVEQLAKLQPFVGFYAHTDQYYGGVGPFEMSPKFCVTPLHGARAA
ncbi:MAG: hypothetical protein R3304_13740, partial [Longimicrobiales bacterium]|nr:hypothetical protein [Longimicrobiales bacterium]